MRAKLIALAVLFVTISHTWGGIYSSFDAEEEIRRYNRQYEIFGPKVLDVLSTIPDKNPVTNPPIRRRYLLIETLAEKGGLKLDTVAQKLDYSTVLIRRGRVVEAVKLLDGLHSENPDNFLVLSQYATALFLTGDPAFEVAAPRMMKKALKNWPASWGDLKDDERKFVELFIPNEYEFARYRRCEERFERLLIHRVKEKKQAKKKAEVEDIDPIFLNGKDEPIRFLNEKKEYEGGRIAEADFKALPRDAVEQVEQLLIWMPNDPRLLWLLAETLNASAMEHPKQQAKSTAVDNALKVFNRLANFSNPYKPGRAEREVRAAGLEDYLEKHPPDQVDPGPAIKDPPEVEMTRSAWWWRQVIVFSIGLAIGLFALWQVQEMRRRRQTRAAAKG